MNKEFLNEWRICTITSFSEFLQQPAYLTQREYVWATFTASCEGRTRPLPAAVRPSVRPPKPGLAEERPERKMFAFHRHHFQKDTGYNLSQQGKERKQLGRTHKEKRYIPQKRRFGASAATLQIFISYSKRNDMSRSRNTTKDICR